MRPKLHAFLGAAAALTALALPLKSAAGQEAEHKDLKTVAAETGLLTRMTEIKRLAGLDGAGDGVSQLTIFAPSDAAFEALPVHIRDGLLAPENRGLLVDTLLHHAVIGRYNTLDLIEPEPMLYPLEAADGTPIEVATYFHINLQGARIVREDLIATNGILHVIDKVLIPDHVTKALEEQVAAAAPTPPAPVPANRERDVAVR